MERVRCARADGDYFDIFSGHVIECVLAQGRADVAAPVCLGYRENDNIAVSSDRIDLPGDIASDRCVAGLGDGHVLASRRVVEFRDHGAVVIGPPAVLMMEDHLAEQRPEMVLVKRAERRDRKLGQGVQIACLVGTDVHGAGEALHDLDSTDGSPVQLRADHAAAILRRATALSRQISPR